MGTQLVASLPPLPPPTTRIHFLDVFDDPHNSLHFKKKMSMISGIFRTYGRGDRRTYARTFCNEFLTTPVTSDVPNTLYITCLFTAHNDRPRIRITDATRVHEPDSSSFRRLRALDRGEFPGFAENIIQLLEAFLFFGERVVPEDFFFHAGWGERGVRVSGRRRRENDLLWSAGK